MLGLDVVATARRRIENRLGMPTHVEAADDSLWPRVDSYTLVQALASLAGRLCDGCGVGELRFHLARHGRIAELDLAWPGPVLPQQALYDGEMAPMSAGGEDSLLTLRDVLERHGAEIVYGRTEFAVVAIPLLLLAKPARPLARHFLPPWREPPGSTIRSVPSSRPNARTRRPAAGGSGLYGVRYRDDRPGPAAGDEIIAIGAVRIVGNRLLRNETHNN